MLTANEATSHFTINGDPTVFAVKQWQSWQALSTSYLFNIIATTTQFIDPQTFLLQTASLSLQTKTDKIDYPGFISVCDFLEKQLNNHYSYRLQLASPLSSLQYFQTNQIFLQQTLPEIARQLLNPLSINAIWDLTATYAKQAMVVQLNENNLACFERLLKQAGLIYRWCYRNNAWQLWIGEELAQSQPQTISLAYTETSGLVAQQDNIYFFSEINQLLPQSWQLTTLADENADNVIMGNAATSSEIPSLGTHYYYGMEANDNDTAQRLTQLIKNACDAKRQIFIAKTQCARLQPGDILHLTYHPHAAYRGHYRVIAVQQQAAQYGDNISNEAATNITPTYQTTLWLISAKQIFRLMPQNVPAIYHSYPALIRGLNNNENFPYLDEQGRYTIKFPFDQRAEQSSSKPLRLLQHHGGAKDNENKATGLHQPLRPQTQVAIAFLHNNPNQAIILGALHYPDNPSPSTVANATQSIIRSVSGNEITIEDLELSPFLRLATGNLQNRLLLDGDPAQSQIQCISEHGMIQTYAKKTLRCTTNADLMQSAQQNHSIQVQQQHLVVSQKQGMQHQAGGNLQLNAQRHLQMQSSNHLLQTEQALQIQSGGNFILTTPTGDAQLMTQQDDLAIQTQQHFLLNSTSGNVTLGQPQGGLLATSSGNLYFSGPNVRLEAPEINLYGLSTFNTTQSSFQYQPEFVTANANQQNSTNPSDDEFKLFVATVYGEAAGCSEVAWRAVGSVIINRVNNPKYKFDKRELHTVTEVIEKTGFDAYSENTPLFRKAYDYLNKISVNAPKYINEMFQILKPVYYYRATITQAIYYYSPKAQQALHLKYPNIYKNPPGWVSEGLKSGKLQIVEVVGLDPVRDDFAFYNELQ